MIKSLSEIIQEIRTRRQQRKMERLLDHLNREVLRQRTLQARAFLKGASDAGFA